MTSNTADAMQKEAGGNEFLICHLPTKDLEHQTGCQQPFQREKCLHDLCDSQAPEPLLKHTGVSSVGTARKRWMGNATQTQLVLAALVISWLRFQGSLCA